MVSIIVTHVTSFHYFFFYVLITFQTPDHFRSNVILFSFTVFWGKVLIKPSYLLFRLEDGNIRRCVSIKL